MNSENSTLRIHSWTADIEIGFCWMLTTLRWEWQVRWITSDSASGRLPPPWPALVSGRRWSRWRTCSRDLTKKELPRHRCTGGLYTTTGQLAQMVILSSARISTRTWSKHAARTDIDLQLPVMWRGVFQKNIGIWKYPPCCFPE